MGSFATVTGRKAHLPDPRIATARSALNPVSAASDRWRRSCRRPSRRPARRSSRSNGSMRRRLWSAALVPKPRRIAREVLRWRRDDGGRKPAADMLTRLWRLLMLCCPNLTRAFALALLLLALCAAEACAHCFVGPRFLPATLATDDPCVADEMSLPTVQYSKTGDLPDSFGWLRAFAVTGQIGYQFPTRSFDVDAGAFIPQTLVYGGSIQYSMPYLKSEIRDYQLPDFINHLIPIVEAQFATPVANNFGNSPITIGTINPGVIWVGTYFQVGAEAVIPVNRASGTGVGFLGQLHLYLDDMFPTTIGRPLLGGSSAPPQ